MAERGMAVAQRRRRLADLAHVLFEQQTGCWPAVLSRGDAPRVVTAVLQLFQSIQDEPGCYIALTDVAKDAAHWCVESPLGRLRGGRIEVARWRHTPNNSTPLVEPRTSGRFCRAVTRPGLCRL
jgi:hypothetical protein